MKKTQFTGTLLTGHKGAAVEVPFDPAKKWAADQKALWKGRRGHPVRVSVNGLTFDSFVVPRSKKFFVLVDDGVQRASGLAIGDAVTVTLEPLGNKADGHSSPRNSPLQRAQRTARRK